MIYLLFMMAQLPPQFAEPKVPAQFSSPCGKDACDCGCQSGEMCTCRPDGMKKYTTYAEWKASISRPPQVFIMPPPVIAAPPPVMRYSGPFSASFPPMMRGGGGGGC